MVTLVAQRSTFLPHFATSLLFVRLPHEQFMHSCQGSISLSMWILAVLVSTLAVLCQGQFLTITSTGARTAQAYLLPASQQYSPSDVPGTIYLFRRGTRLDSAALVTSQRPILSVRGGDVRQIVLVVVPTGILANELLTDGDVQSAGFQQVTLDSTFLVCPSFYDGFQHRNPADAAQFPVTNALYANGTATRYVHFGVAGSAAASTAYRQVAPNGTVIGYSTATLPGDQGFTVMRTLSNVTSDIAEVPVANSTAPIKFVLLPVESIPGKVVIDTASIFVLYIVGVQIFDGSGATGVFPANRGFAKGESVAFYEFNASRVSTTVATAKFIVPAKMYWVPGQQAPIVDSVPGDATYSDLWAQYQVSLATLNASQAPYLSVPSNGWAAFPTGRYLNCPVLLNDSNTLEVQTDAIRLAVYYKGTVRYCFNFSWVASCVPRPAYKLVRSGDGSTVRNNDLFVDLPYLRGRSYTPFTWLMPYTVSQLYLTGSARSAAGLINPLLPQDGNGIYANRPITNATGDIRNVTYTNTVTIDAAEGVLHRFFLDWTLDAAAAMLHVRVTVSLIGEGGMIGIGFSGDVGHSGQFVVGYLIQGTGEACLRQFSGTGRSFKSLAAASSNPFNVSNAAFAVGDNTATFAFSRSLSARPSSLTIPVNGVQRVTLVARRNATASCVADPSQLRHDATAELSNFNWMSTSSLLSSTAMPIGSPESTNFFTVAPTVAPTANTSNATAYRGSGSYRCDSFMSFSWVINDARTDIEFSLLLPSDFVGWAAIGLGSRMVGADVMFVSRWSDGSVTVDDRKGIAQSLPPRDASQDVFLVSSSNAAIKFRRKLNTGDTGSSAQIPSRQILSPRTIKQALGWAGGIRVAYYSINNDVQFPMGNRNASSANWYYQMSNETLGSPVASFQPDVVDIVPGQPGYSDMWNIAQVVVPKTFSGPPVRYVTDIPSGWKVTFTSRKMFCPLVHSSTTIDSPVVQSRQILYRSFAYTCLAFPSNNANAARPQRVILIRDNATNATVDAIFEKGTEMVDFTPFAWVYLARVPPTFSPGLWTNIGLLLNLTSGLATDAGLSVNLTEAGFLASLPVVSLNNQSLTQMPLTSTPEIDPAELSGYPFSKVVADVKGPATAAAKVTLYWDYNADVRIVKILVVASGIQGYVAVGFSNESYTLMEQADIVMGYVTTSTSESVGCVRTLRSEFSTGAPSSISSMFIRDAQVRLINGAILLSFERDFTANALPSAVIPGPTEGARSRILFATLRSPVTSNCSSTSFASLYHGTSPHGSTMVDWLGVTTEPQTTQMDDSSNTDVRRVTLAREDFFYRGTKVPFYCAPNDISLPVAASSATFSTTPVALATNPFQVPAAFTTPTDVSPWLLTSVMYIFVNGSSFAVLNADDQLPVLSAYPGRNNYTGGLWHVRYVVRNDSQPVRTLFTSAGKVASASPSEIRFLGTPPTGLPQVMNCPVVHAETAVENRDLAQFSMVQAFFDGQRVTCLRMGDIINVDESPLRIGTIFNVSFGGERIVDSLSLAESLRRVSSVTATSAVTDAEGTVGRSQFPTTTVRNCVPVVSALPALLAGNPTVNLPVSSSTLLSGYHAGRKVAYVLAPAAAPRFANRFELPTNDAYILKSTDAEDFTMLAPSFQSQAIVTSRPGMGSYSDLWRIVLVRVPTSIVVNTTLTSVADISGFKKVTTDVFWNCPIINVGTSFAAGVATTTDVLMSGGIALKCAHLGYISRPPPALPIVYRLKTSTGAPIVNNEVFATVPGHPDYYPFMWVVSATLPGDAPVALTSLDALDQTISTRQEAMTLFNVAIVSVDRGLLNATISNASLTLQTVSRSADDPAARLAAAAARSFAALLPPSVPSLAPIYVFRRTPQIESDEVPGQLPVVNFGPGEWGYSFLSGTEGYTDVKAVRIVAVPRNASIVSQLTSETMLLSAVSSNGWTVNASTGLQMAVFLGLATPNNSAITCPTTQVWLNDQRINALDCGLTTRRRAIATPLAASASTVFFSRQIDGSSVWTQLDLNEHRSSIVEDFSKRNVPVFAGGRLIRSLQLTGNMPQSAADPTTIARKYVFRYGPDFFTSPPVLLHAVVDFSGTGNVAYSDIVAAQIYVVNVPLPASVANISANDTSIDGSSLPTFVASVSELYDLVQRLCWSMEPIPVYEIGPIVLFSSLVPPDVSGLTMDTVYINGAKYKHIVSGRRTSPTNQSLLTTAFEVVWSGASPPTTLPFSRYFILPAGGNGTQSQPLVKRSPLWFVRRVTLKDDSRFRTLLSASDAELTAIANQTSNIVILHNYFVSRQPYVNLPQLRQLTRSAGYFGARSVYFYDLGTSTSLATAPFPNPMYRFIAVQEQSNTVIGSIGVPLITALPGHADYNDVKAVYQCTILGEDTTSVPTNEEALQNAITRGTIRACEFSDVRLLPVVHRDTQVEGRDSINSLTNPNGVTSETVQFDGELVGVLDFGPVVSPFGNSSTRIAIPLFNSTRAAVPNNAILVGGFVNSAGASPLRVVENVVVDDSLPQGVIKTYSALRNFGSLTLGTSIVACIAVVATDSETSPLLFDDTNITGSTQSVIWAYGRLQTTLPIDWLQHTARGFANVDFFTGSTDQTSNGLGQLTGDRTLQLGSDLVVSWTLERAVEPARRAYHESASYVESYSFDETDIVFTMRARTNVWGAIGLTQTGTMTGSDIILVYAATAGEVASAGGSLSLTGNFTAPSSPDMPQAAFVHYTRRKATGFFLPPVNVDAPLRLRSAKAFGGGVGYEIVVSRPLRATERNSFAIVDAEQTIIWATGPFDALANLPTRHTAQGAMKVNFIGGRPATVPAAQASFWYIAATVALILFTLLMAFVLRLVEPGAILYSRPLASCLASHNVLAKIVLCEWLVILMAMACVAVWLTGAALDNIAFRKPAPGFQTIGNGAQFLYFFVFIPLCRWNPVLRVFGSSFHRAAKWFRGLLACVVLLGWIHGLGMMATVPERAFTWPNGTFAILGLVFVSLLAVVAFRVVNLSHFANYLATAILATVSTICICIHSPLTAAGLAPAFLIVLIDVAMRFHDRQTRVGEIRSYALPVSTVCAIEVRMPSPWHRLCTRPFRVPPGGFLYVQLASMPGYVPLSVSSKVLQESGDEFATFTCHIKAPLVATDSFASWIVAEARSDRLTRASARVEGPYGGCGLRLKWYRHLTLIAGGIGMASVMPVLEALVFDPDLFRISGVRNVRMVWLVKQPEELIVFANEIVEVLKAPRPFDVQLFLFVTGVQENPIPAAIKAGPHSTPRKTTTQRETFSDIKSAANAEDDVEEGGAALPAPHADERSPLSPSPPRADDVHAVEMTEVGAVGTDANAPWRGRIPKHELFAAVPVLAGHPNWVRLFTDVAAAVQGDSGPRRAGVYLSAPQDLREEIIGAADAVGRWRAGVQLHVDSETYDFR